MNAGRHSVHIVIWSMNCVEQYGAVCRCIRKACLTTALLGLIAINAVGCASFSFDDPFQSAIDDHDLSERTARYERAGKDKGSAWSNARIDQFMENGR